MSSGLHWDTFLAWTPSGLLWIDATGKRVVRYGGLSLESADPSFGAEESLAIQNLEPQEGVCFVADQKVVNSGETLVAIVGVTIGARNFFDQGPRFRFLVLDLVGKCAKLLDDLLPTGHLDLIRSEAFFGRGPSSSGAKRQTTTPAPGDSVFFGMGLRSDALVRLVRGSLNWKNSTVAFETREMTDELSLVRVDDDGTVWASSVARWHFGDQDNTLIRWCPEEAAVAFKKQPLRNFWLDPEGQTVLSLKGERLRFWRPENTTGEPLKTLDLTSSGPWLLNPHVREIGFATRWRGSIFDRETKRFDFPTVSALVFQTYSCPAVSEVTWTKVENERESLRNSCAASLSTRLPLDPEKVCWERLRRSLDPETFALCVGFFDARLRKTKFQTLTTKRHSRLLSAGSR